MGREILVVWAGRRQQDAWQGLCDDYLARIAKWVEIREIPVKVRSAAAEPGRRKAEGAALLTALPDPCWTVAVDRRGKARSSTELAGWIGRKMEDWPHPLAFLIGSDLGLAPEVRSEARESLSLGPMTLPHQLARVVLLEQLYRALSIGAGIKYHRGPL